MDRDLIKIGQQITEARVIRYILENKIWYSSTEILEGLGISSKEVEGYIKWINLFNINSMYYDFMHDELKIKNTALYNLVYDSLLLYGNMYIRDVLRHTTLSWGSIAHKLKSKNNITNSEFDGEYLKKVFKNLCNYRNKLIEKCKKEYDELVVYEMARLKIDFSNTYEIGYMVGYYEDLQNWGCSSDDLLKRYATEDELKILFPDKKFKKEIEAYKADLIDILKRRNEYENNKDYVNNIIIGIAIINKTTCVEVANMLTR